MMRMAVWAVALFLAVVPLAQAFEIEGVYDVQGNNPDEKTTYGGTATVTVAGDAYQVVWKIAGQEIHGTGLRLGDTFAVSLIGPNNQGAGLALFLSTPEGGMDGRWVTVGSKEVGTENWTRRQ